MYDESHAVEEDSPRGIEHLNHHDFDDNDLNEKESDQFERQ